MSGKSDFLSSSTADEAGVDSLGRRLYERALVRRTDEHITDPRGQEIGWLLDTRVPMLDAELFSEVGDVLASRLTARGMHQVAGYGFGAYALVGAVLAESGPGVRGGYVRPERKPYGRQRLIEGPLRRDAPVALVDDILNSGRSAARAVSLLRASGYEVAGLQTLFRFTWSDGQSRLAAEGLWVDALLDLNLRAEGSAGSDSQ